MQFWISFHVISVHKTGLITIVWRRPAGRPTAKNRAHYQYNVNISRCRGIWNDGCYTQKKRCVFHLRTRQRLMSCSLAPIQLRKYYANKWRVQNLPTHRETAETRCDTHIIVYGGLVCLVCSVFFCVLDWLPWVRLGHSTIWLLTNAQVEMWIIC